MATKISPIDKTTIANLGLQSRTRPLTIAILYELTKNALVTVRESPVSRCTVTVSRRDASTVLTTPFDTLNAERRLTGENQYPSTPTSGGTVRPSPTRKRA